MKTAKKTIELVLEKLRADAALQEVEFVTAYRRQSFKTPLQKPLAAVGTHGVLAQAGKKSSGIQVTAEGSLTVAVDLSVPLAYGGEACAQLLDQIGACLLTNVQEPLCTVKTGAVKYQSNAGVFTAQLLFTITQTGPSQQEADAQNVVLYVNGNRLYAQGVTVKEMQDVYNVQCYGESEPYAVVSRGRQYEVTIKKSVSKTNPSFLFEQGNCAVAVYNAGGDFYLSGCYLKNMESRMENALYYMDTLVLTAKSKTTVL